MSDLHHPDNYFAECHNQICGKRLRPDYLAPENLHELVRVCLENDLEIKIRAHKHRGMAGARNLKPNGPRKFIEFHDPTVEKISTALAEAIVETKG